MPSEAEDRIPPAEINGRVLQSPAGAVTSAEAAYAVKRFLARKWPALAGAVQVGADGDAVILRARGEAPAGMLRDVRELITHREEEHAEIEIEVDADEFAIELVDVDLPEPDLEREMLQSIVRYFPYPVCEWFEISAGELLLTDHEVRFTPKYVIMQGEEGQAEANRHLIRLDEVEECSRGDWWDVPCLMLRTELRTWRYGWPAKRGEVETIFDVDEWVARIRTMIGEEA